MRHSVLPACLICVAATAASALPASAGPVPLHRGRGVASGRAIPCETLPQVPPVDSTRRVPRDSVVRRVARPVPVPSFVITPDKEGDPSGAVGSVTAGAFPDSLQLTVRAGLGAVSTLLGHDLLRFRSDSIRTDPLAEHGADYRTTPGDFTRDNLKVLRGSAAPDVRADLTLGDVLAGHRLRALLGGTLERTSRYTELERNYETVDADNNVYLIRRQFRPLGRTQTRYGAVAGAAYTFDARNEVGLALAGSLQQTDEASLLYDTNYVNVPILNKTDGTLHVVRTQGEMTLTGHHLLGDFDLRWRGALSAIRQDQPDHAELTTSAALAGSTVASSLVFTGVLRDWQRNDDLGLAGSVDVAWSGLSAMSVTITAGALYRDRRRENLRNTYRLVPATDSANHVPFFSSVDTQPWVVLNANGTPEFANNNYTSEEGVAGSYLMGRWLGGPWDIVAGARAEATDAHYATQDATVQAEVSADKTYVDLLPSLSVRYAMSDAIGLRFSAGQAITRPRFYDLVPYNYVSGEFRFSGNPYLKRTATTSVDVSMEADAGGGGRYGGSLFYKRIIDPIESTLDLSNPALPAVIPNNLANATAFGVRLSGSVDLLSMLRLDAAYTYTHSAITSDKLIVDRSQGKVLQIPVTRALQGVPEQVATMALVLPRAAWGTSGRIAVSYTGRLLRQVSLFDGTDHYEEPFPLLGLAIEQRLAGDLSVYAGLDNLLDAVRSIRLPDGTLVERERPGIVGTIGASWRY